MNDIRLWTTLGTATPAQAILTAAATDWEIRLKIANLMLGLLVALVSVIIMVRKQILHERRNNEAARTYAKWLEQQKTE